MNGMKGAPARRELLAMLAAGWALAGGPARAAGLGAGLTSLLNSAADASLARLGRPGAFYNDASIRIGLPLLDKLGGLSPGGEAGGGLGGVLGSVLGGSGLGGSGLGGQAGGALKALTGGLTRTLNDAASAAAGQAQPIFHAAISRLQPTDLPGIVKKTDGATQYLRQSAGAELHGALRPLIDRALGSLGAYSQLDQLGKSANLLASAGISRDALGRSVTEQALNGIFKYIGGEEARLRANPIGSLQGLLGGLLKN